MKLLLEQYPDIFPHKSMDNIQNRKHKMLLCKNFIHIHLLHLLLPIILLIFLNKYFLIMQDIFQILHIQMFLIFIQEILKEFKDLDIKMLAILSKVDLVHGINSGLYLVMQEEIGVKQFLIQKDIKFIMMEAFNMEKLMDQYMNIL